MNLVFFISAFLGLATLLLLLIFLVTTFYHLSQYRLPGQSLKISFFILFAVSLLLSVSVTALFFISF